MGFLLVPLLMLLDVDFSFSHYNQRKYRCNSGMCGTDAYLVKNS